MLHLLDLCHRIEDCKAHELDEGVEMQLVAGHPSHEVVPWVILGIPDQPEEQAFEELIACHGRVAHDKEDAEGN